MRGHVPQRVGKALLGVSIAFALAAGLAIRVRAQQQATDKEPTPGLRCRIGETDPS